MQLNFFVIFAIAADEMKKRTTLAYFMLKLATK